MKSAWNRSKPSDFLRASVLVLLLVLGCICPTAALAQRPHDADLDGNWSISHEELLPVIELWRAGEYHVDATGQYAPGQARPTEPGETITINLPGLPAAAKPLEMVLIPAGTFMMGSPSTEKDREDNEGPQHEVTITNPFYLGKYEVTQAQWVAVTGMNPSGFSGNPNHPVESVSWGVCQEFIEELNSLGLGTFRLPTEAEWEYACRAGTSTRFYWGNDLFYTKIEDYAWYSGNSGSQTHEVGLKLPNDFGLYDMSGNVWEWCQDWYGAYSPADQVDPIGQQSGSYRVLRGGCWYYLAWRCRSALRLRYTPSGTYFVIGFRVVVSSRME